MRCCCRLSWSGRRRSMRSVARNTCGICTSESHVVASSEAAAAARQDSVVQLSSVPVVKADVPRLQEDAVVSTLGLADGMTIQVAAFRDPDRATTVIQQLRGAGLPAFRRTDGVRHLVLVG